MEALLWFIFVTIMGFGFKIYDILSKIHIEIIEQNKLKKEQENLYTQILSQFEINNYKKPW